MTNALSKEDQNVLLAIRDLVGSHPLNPEFLKDVPSWRRLCDGLDGITDAGSPIESLAALNAVRVELGMIETEAQGAEIPPTISVGLQAVKTELGDRANALRSSHHQRLSELFPSDTGYPLEKASAAVRAFLPGQDRSRLAYDRAMGIDVLRSALEQLVDHLKQRGYDAGVTWHAERALYVVRRATEMFDGDPSIEPEDIDVMVDDALPGLIKKAREMAEEIDESNAQREDGWTLPGVPN